MRHHLLAKTLRQIQHSAPDAYWDVFVCMCRQYPVLAVHCSSASLQSLPFHLLLADQPCCYLVCTSMPWCKCKTTLVHWRANPYQTHQGCTRLRGTQVLLMCTRVGLGNAAHSNMHMVATMGMLGRGRLSGLRMPLFYCCHLGGESQWGLLSTYINRPHAFKFATTNLHGSKATMMSQVSLCDLAQHIWEMVQQLQFPESEENGLREWQGTWHHPILLALHPCYEPQLRRHHAFGREWWENSQEASGWRFCMGTASPSTHHQSDSQS